MSGYLWKGHLTAGQWKYTQCIEQHCSLEQMEVSGVWVTEHRAGTIKTVQNLES